MSKKFKKLEFLEWFFEDCNFGPAHEDVISCMVDDYEEQTGQVVPEEYDYRKEVIDE